MKGIKRMLFAGYYLAIAFACQAEQHTFMAVLNAMASLVCLGAAIATDE